MDQFLVAVVADAVEEKGIALGQHRGRKLGRPLGGQDQPESELPAFSSDALSPRSALMLLKRNLQHPRHEFWADDVPVAEALAWTEQHLQGHRQLTDGYLLDLAYRRKGRLASLDKGIQELAASERGSSAELIPTDEESA